MIEGYLFGKELEERREQKVNIPIVSIKQVKESSFTYRAARSPNDVYQVVTEFLQEKDREYFICLTLNKKGEINNISVVSIGSLYSAIVSPREVFKTAIMSNAASLIIAHNHPSGNTTPSTEDKELTQRLVEAGEIIGIKIVDHIIVGDNTYLSFQEKGLM